MKIKTRYCRTAAFISYHGARHSDRTAIIRDGTPISYGVFNGELARMTRALAPMARGSGQIAPVSHDDLYIQLLVVIACETLGIITGSFRQSEAHEAAGLLEVADLVFTQSPVAHQAAGRVVGLSDDWIAAALESPIHETPPITRASAEDSLVIFRSSGTTGAPKLMLLTHRVLNHRLAQQRRRDAGLGLTKDSRFLATMHLSVGSIYMGAANCFRLGAIFMFSTHRTAAAVLPELRLTHFTILPYHLRQLLDRLPPGHKPAPELTVQTIGARLADDLRDRATQKLGARLIENYGTNEIGSIGEVDQDGILTLSHSVEARVIADGAVLPAGDIGVLQVRAPTMIGGYMNDPATTRIMFDDGWFMPGDLACLTASGNLRLVGRRADVLNLGGAKMTAADLEARFLNTPGLLDLAIVQIESPDQTACLAVCVVADETFAMQDFLAALRIVILYPFNVHPVATIPRTIEGKIMRTALQKTIMDIRRPARAVAHAHDPEFTAAPLPA